MFARRVVWMGIGLAMVAAAPAIADEDIPFQYPFGDEGGDGPAIVSSIEVVRKDSPPQGRLRVHIKEGPCFEDASPGYSNYFGILDGSDPRQEDADSAQFAVRYLKHDGTECGKATNAFPGRNGAEAIRVKAAEWLKGNATKGERDAYADADIPPDAAQVDVVLVYTDLLTYANEHRYGTENGRETADYRMYSGDVPGVIAVWHGQLTDGTWKFKSQMANVFRHMPDYPKMAQLPELVARAKDVVQRTTGFTLEERPSSLKSASTKTEMEEVLLRAATAKQINNKDDTGFDLVVD
jgi:hypothetical protein